MAHASRGVEAVGPVEWLRYVENEAAQQQGAPGPSSPEAERYKRAAQPLDPFEMLSLAQRFARDAGVSARSAIAQLGTSIVQMLQGLVSLVSQLVSGDWLVWIRQALQFSAQLIAQNLEAAPSLFSHTLLAVVKTLADLLETVVERLTRVAYEGVSYAARAWGSLIEFYAREPDAAAESARRESAAGRVSRQVAIYCVSVLQYGPEILQLYQADAGRVLLDNYGKPLFGRLRELASNVLGSETGERALSFMRNQPWFAALLDQGRIAAREAADLARVQALALLSPGALLALISANAMRGVASMLYSTLLPHIIKAAERYASRLYKFVTNPGPPLFAPKSSGGSAGVPGAEGAPDDATASLDAQEKVFDRILAWRERFEAPDSRDLLRMRQVRADWQQKKASLLPSTLPRRAKTLRELGESLRRALGPQLWAISGHIEALYGAEGDSIEARIGDAVGDEDVRAFFANVFDATPEEALADGFGVLDALERELWVGLSDVALRLLPLEQDTADGPAPMVGQLTRQERARIRQAREARLENLEQLDQALQAISRAFQNADKADWEAIGLNRELGAAERNLALAALARSLEEQKKFAASDRAQKFRRELSTQQVLSYRRYIILATLVATASATIYWFFRPPEGLNADRFARIASTFAYDTELELESGQESVVISLLRRVGDAAETHGRQLDMLGETISLKPVMGAADQSSLASNFLGNFQKIMQRLTVLKRKPEIVKGWGDAEVENALQTLIGRGSGLLTYSAKSFSKLLQTCGIVYCSPNYKIDDVEGMSTTEKKEFILEAVQGLAPIVSQLPYENVASAFAKRMTETELEFSRNAFDWLWAAIFRSGPESIAAVAELRDFFRNFAMTVKKYWAQSGLVYEKIFPVGLVAYSFVIFAAVYVGKEPGKAGKAALQDILALFGIAVASRVLLSGSLLEQVVVAVFGLGLAPYVFESIKLLMRFYGLGYLADLADSVPSAVRATSERDLVLKANQYAKDYDGKNPYLTEQIFKLAESTDADDAEEDGDNGDDTTEGAEMTAEDFFLKYLDQ
jgi:hypothetical protein